MTKNRKFILKRKNHNIFKKQNIAQATILISIFLFLTKIIGYFREILIAKYFGTSSQTDAFLVALMIPLSIMGLISGGLGTLIIPIYLKKTKENLEKAKIFINQIFFIWIIITSILCFGIYLFTPFFVKLFAYGFDKERFNLTIKLTKYLIPMGFMTVFIGFFTGIFQAKKQFLYPILIGFIGNIIIVLSLILFTNNIGINSWVYGVLLSSCFSFLLLFLFLYKKWNFFKKFNLKKWQKKEIKNFLIILLPLILISGLNTLNQLIDKIIASTLSVGSIAILNFAQRIYTIPLGLLMIPLTIAIFPTFSSMAINSNKKKDYSKILKKAINFSWSIIIPISVIMIVLAEPITKFLFQRGAFTNTSTQLTYPTVIMYLIGLFAISANYFLTKIFYSFKNTKTPLILSAIIISINIVANIILSKILGVKGIALATSIASITGFILYYQVIKNKYFKNEDFKISWKKILKIIPLSILLGAISLLLKPYLLSYSSGVIPFGFKFIISGIILATFYYFFAQLLKIQEIKIIKNYLKN
ncbi:murein biosynthesis integral membrane protein MurJ [Patescibacteria group bacterium]|nr:murein biosynthesis integral membrane protein MurJ [Patescibacteria group bacterium]